jgi:predicted flap endonuclease-1-like 5' DNA nuclease
VKLVHDLARLYAVPFETKLVKPLLKSLLSCGAVSGGSVALIALGMASPGLQTLVGGGFTGGLAGSTLATSEIFIRHFESGGTLEDFAQKNPPATAATIETSPSNSSRKEEPPKTPSTAEETFKDQESAEHAAVLSDSPTSEPQKPVFDEIYGIGNVYRKRLLSHGIYDISALAALDPERLKVILGQRVSLATARDFISQARTLVNVNSS